MLHLGAMKLIYKKIKIDYDNNIIENKTTNIFLVIFSLKHVFIEKTKGKDLIRLQTFENSAVPNLR